MSYLFLFFSFLFCSYSWGAVSFTDTQQIFNNLQNVSHTYYKLNIAKDSEINAEFYGNTITVNSGLLRWIGNRDELAEVLGHEITHGINNDDGSTPLREYRADYGGFILASQAGYNSCRGINLFKRFAKLDGNKAGDTHPRSLDRYNTLRRYCK